MRALDTCMIPQEHVKSVREPALPPGRGRLQGPALAPVQVVQVVDILTVGIPIQAIPTLLSLRDQRVAVGVALIAPMSKMLNKREAAPGKIFRTATARTNARKRVRASTRGTALIITNRRRQNVSVKNKSANDRSTRGTLMPTRSKEHSKQSKTGAVKNKKNGFEGAKSTREKREQTKRSTSSNVDDTGKEKEKQTVRRTNNIRERTSNGGKLRLPGRKKQERRPCSAVRPGARKTKVKSSWHTSC